MRFLALFLTALLLLAPAASLPAANPPRGEFLILTGGPALDKWEKYRDAYHDRFWGNFVRASRVSIEAIRKQYGPAVPITWMVYREAYENRAAQESRPLLSFIESVRDKYGVNLVWFNSGSEVLNYINYGQNRLSLPIVHFEYFGHSNRACFMFDYSNHIAAASKAWLHEKELSAIRSGAIARNAYCKSWGCHTGEGMNERWRDATGSVLIGAVGKTDYAHAQERPQPLPELSPGGRWVTK